MLKRVRITNRYFSEKVGLFLCGFFLLMATMFQAQVIDFTGEVVLNHVGRYETGVFDEGGAEIVSYHESTQRLFSVNAANATVDVIDISDPSNPNYEFMLSVQAYGASANSLVVAGDVVAVAVEGFDINDLGSIVFFDAITGEYIHDVDAGFLPDAITTNFSGTVFLVANEGEPSDDYLIDPEGSITLIDISGGADFPNVTQISLAELTPEDLDPSIRIFGPGASIAQDLEPEYCAFSPDGTTGFVVCQENNCIIKLDIASASILEVLPLGFKDHSLSENALDPSNQDGVISIQPWPALGMYQPDAMICKEVNGIPYLFTANEGDSRDYDGFSEEDRVKDLDLDPDFLAAFPDLQESEMMGRLKTTTTLGDIDGDGDFDEIYSYGTRSFSIWDLDGNLVFDSGKMIEEHSAAVLGELGFNSNNDENDSFDSRSDDKGPEPEAITVADFAGSTYAFVGLERVGGVMIFDITNPLAAEYRGYYNDRDFSDTQTILPIDPAGVGDLGPECLIHIEAAKSPNGIDLIVVANEVSGTISILAFESYLEGCTSETACNYNPDATFDAGTCIEPTPECEICNELPDGSWELLFLDSDGDGLCDADEWDCTAPEACNYNPLADFPSPELCMEPIPGCMICDGEGGLIFVDTDEDGICDAWEEPGCTNENACNYEPWATEDDGSCVEPIPNCLECGPNGSLVLQDDDGDGICDADEIVGCTDPVACNYSPLATDDSGNCLEAIADCYDCNAAGTGLVIIDYDGDGICNAYEIAGCTNEDACNYDPNATDDNGSCLVPVPNCLVCNNSNDGLILVDNDGDGLCDGEELPGCTSDYACNYDPGAIIDDGSCIFPVPNCLVCNEANDGLVLQDTDADGVCDAAEIWGCTNPEACNFYANATEDDGMCLIPVLDCLECDEDELVLIDTDGDGICDADDDNSGCTDPNACNYDPLETDDDGSCFFEEPGCSECGPNGETLIYIDSDNDGICDGNETSGCTTNPLACNYDPNATDEAYCIVPTPNCTACNSLNLGLLLIDSDGDGVCDAEEVDGCDDPAACNFNPDATENDGSCLFEYADCLECDQDGTILVLIDTDGDGTCDADEVDGCEDEGACNFNPNATEDDGSCTYVDPGCTTCVYNTYVGELELVDTDGDGICDADEIAGCTSPGACNFDPLATDPHPESCLEPEPNCTECEGLELVIIDDDGDGVCNAEEQEGCTSHSACNFDPEATEDDGSCLEPVPDCIICGPNGSMILLDADGDGICNGEEIFGCTNPEACNYNPEATEEDSTCLEPIENCYICSDQGYEIVDDDGDGICNAYDIEGCTSETACNYDPVALQDDGTCIEPIEDCIECGPFGTLYLVDNDGDGICDADEVSGCMDPVACNYYPDASDDDGSCLEPIANCYECDEQGGLVIVDDDGDGICNAYEFEGCTDEGACNYDVLAVNDDGSCIFPTEECWECSDDGQSLIIVDTDGDGICDLEEQVGCTDQMACNFDPEASQDDGSCVVPVQDCTECYTTMGGIVYLIQIDADADGICDADEFAGCTDPLAVNYNTNATDEDGSCSYDCIDTPYCEFFESENTIWQQFPSDDFDWSWSTGGTPSLYTGPSQAFEGDYYYFIEASYPNYPNKTAILTSVCFEIPEVADLSFAYHMAGVYDAVGSLSLEASYDGGISWGELWSESGHQGFEWTLVTIPLTNAGQVSFRFTGQTAQSWKGDIAIDAFCISSDDVPGCTNPLAMNYNPLANLEDGSCEFFYCANVVQIGYCEDFENGLGLFNQGDQDDFDWTISCGPTASAGTGPDSGSVGGCFVYAEASAPNYPFKSTYLNAPCLDVGNESNAHVSFDYHMLGDYVGDLYLQFSTDGVNWTYAWIAQGSQGDQWQNVSIDVGSFVGDYLYVRLEAITSVGWHGDIAVDSFCFESGEGGLTPADYDSKDVMEHIMQRKNTLSSQENEQGSFIKIYPNPVASGDYLNIEMTAKESGCRLVLRDIQGREVLAQVLTQSSSYVTLEIPADLVSGSYVLSLSRPHSSTSQLIQVIN